MHSSQQNGHTKSDAFPFVQLIPKLRTVNTQESKTAGHRIIGYFIAC